MAFLEWIHDQLTILAEAFGEPLTQERAEIYVGSLSDISQERLRNAFHRALNQSTFFPKVAELRQLAGSNVEDEKKVEAQAAWNYVNEYLRKWGTEKLPILSSGKWITAPPLEPRLEYAIRQIGGLWRLNQVTDENYAFIHRDFCEAYRLAPVAELMAPQLLEQFADRKLLGSVKRLVEAGNKDNGLSKDSMREEELTDEEELGVLNELTPASKAGLRRQLDEDLAGRVSPSPRGDGSYSSAAKKSMLEEKSNIPDELTPERKTELRRQLAEELAKRGIPRSTARLE